MVLSLNLNLVSASTLDGDYSPSYPVNASENDEFNLGCGSYTV